MASETRNEAINRIHRMTGEETMQIVGNVSLGYLLGQAYDAGAASHAAPTPPPATGTLPLGSSDPRVAAPRATREQLDVRPIVDYIVAFLAKQDIYIGVWWKELVEVAAKAASPSTHAAPTVQPVITTSTGAPAGVGPAPWERQESCPECDGDGCNACNESDCEITHGPKADPPSGEGTLRVCDEAIFSLDGPTLDDAKRAIKSVLQRHPDGTEKTK